MIEVEIPNDIKEFEPKLIGPFTLRQIVCVIGVVATSLAGFFLLNQFFDNGLRFVLPMVFDVPWILIGYYKPYGMKFEEYFKSQINTTIIPPKKRLYKTENLYEIFEQQIAKEEAAKTQSNTNTNKKTNSKKKKGGTV